ncbi:MAG: hypothetical protein MUF81_10690 [Verrucomicrobia bacterium]|nr:hypothetical protein [Verrucomicrobiota bacterium]
MTWSGSAGLRYRVQYKTNLSDAVWQNLSGDVIATNILSSKVDAPAPGIAQRFYRVLLLD